MIFRRGSTRERTSVVPTVAEAAENKKRQSKRRTEGKNGGQEENMKDENRRTKERVEQEVVFGRDDGNMPDIGIELLQDTDGLY
jgi:hypothetical protein